MSTNGDGWKRYPRPVYTDPAQIDADIRNGTFARKTRAHAEAVEAWYAQQRPPLGVQAGVGIADAEVTPTRAIGWATTPENVNGDQPPDRSPFASPDEEDRCARF